MVGKDTAVADAAADGVPLAGVGVGVDGDADGDVVAVFEFLC
jgi:hypothetical protein